MVEKDKEEKNEEKKAMEVGERRKWKRRNVESTQNQNLEEKKDFSFNI